MAVAPCRGQNIFYIYIKKELWLRVISSSLTSISVVIWWRDCCIFLCSPKAKSCEIKFPKLSFCLSKLLSVAQGENEGVKELESEKKVFNSLQPLLIVPREQQIGPGYKTLIDLWKVEATAHSQVPVFNCTLALSVYEAVIIKKMESFPVQKEKKNLSMTQNRS